jgi:hypothetical protein
MNTTNILLGGIAGLMMLSITYWIGREQGTLNASAAFSTSISAASIAASANMSPAQIPQTPVGAPPK